MKKKKILLFFILFLSFTISIFNAVAHPGRTDENGGHWNRKTGEYHFHTGEYAGRESSGSSSVSEYKPFTPPYEPPTKNPYKENTNKSINKSSSTSLGSSSSVSKLDSNTKPFGDYFIDILAFIPALLLAVPSLCFLIYLVFSFISYIFKDCIYYGLLEKHLPRYKIKDFDCTLNSLKHHQLNLIDLAKETDILKQNIKIPKEYKIGKDGLPKDKNANLDWGKTFTLYKSYKGGKLHSLYNCCYAKYPLHIYNCKTQVKSLSDFCKLCSNTYTFPDMSWYNNYLKYKQSKSSFQKLESLCNDLQKEADILHKKCNSPVVKALVFFCPQNKKELKKTNNKYNKLKNNIYCRKE